MHPALTAQGRPAVGFTMIELMIVMVIAAILITLAAPSFNSFVATQLVRSTASDIMSDFALARAQAIENSHRVYFERTGTTWTNGWRIYVDKNDNGAYDPGEEIKIFNGLTGNVRVCTNVGDFATDIIFRPDGRVVRTAVPSTNDGIYVIDDMGDTNLNNDKIRGILFGPSGRATVVDLNPDYQAVPLPC